MVGEDENGIPSLKQTDGSRKADAACADDCCERTSAFKSQDERPDKHTDDGIRQRVGVGTHGRR